MIKMIGELLSELNSDLSLYENMRKDTAFSIIMSYAYEAEKKMLLPEGVPEFKPDWAGLGMSPTTLRYEARRLYVFSRADLTQKRRELLYVQLLESVHPSEAEILCLVKDQRLHTKFANLTHEWAASVGLRGLVSKEEQFRPESESNKEGVVEIESPEGQLESRIEKETPIDDGKVKIDKKRKKM